MKYMLMILRDEAAEANKSPAEFQRDSEAYGAFTQAMKDRKVYVAGDALSPVSTATTVRVREGKTVTTDGPFAETKEQIAGYYILDCANLDEAIEWAAKIPHASRAAIEIRPVRVVNNAATAS